MTRDLERSKTGVARLFLLASAALAGPLSGQTEASPSVAIESFEPLDFGTGPYEEMEALMEVTILNIDVLTLTVRVGPDTAAHLGRLVEGYSEYSNELADSVAAIMLGADDAWASQVFHRDVSLGRLTGGMRETVEKAVADEFVSEEYATAFSADLPEWFGFLGERGAKKGDTIFFRIRGDSLRTTFLTVDGQVLMDDVGMDAEGRRASIPSFFARGTRFRERLVESLLREEVRLRH